MGNAVTRQLLSQPNFLPLHSFAKLETGSHEWLPRVSLDGIEEPMRGLANAATMVGMTGELGNRLALIGAGLLRVRRFVRAPIRFRAGSSWSPASAAETHPRAWANLRPVLETTLGKSIHEDGTRLPMIAFDVVARR